MQRIALTTLILIATTTAGLADDTVLEINGAQTSLIQNTFVASPIAGVVSEVNAREGARVTAGTCLVRLNDLQAVTEVLAAKAKLEAARLESSNDVDQRFPERSLEVRIRELESSLKANQKYSGAVSDTEIARLSLVVDQSRLAIEQAKHELAIAAARASEQEAAVSIAEAILDKHAITTTVDGFVAEVAIETGEWVEPGTPIVRVITLDPIRVECFVDGRLYGPNLVGGTVQFIPNTDDTEQEPLTGEVTFVSPELHPVTSQARLWATIKNPKLKLRAGMQGRLAIRLAK